MYNQRLRYEVVPFLDRNLILQGGEPELNPLYYIKGCSSGSKRCRSDGKDFNFDFKWCSSNVKDAVLLSKIAILASKVQFSRYKVQL